MGESPLSRAPPSPRRPPRGLNRTRARASPPHASRRTRASPSPARHRRPVESSRRSSTARAGSVTAPRVPSVGHTASVHTATWLKKMVNTCDGALKNMVWYVIGHTVRLHRARRLSSVASDIRTVGQSDERLTDLMDCWTVNRGIGRFVERESATGERRGRDGRRGRARWTRAFVARGGARDESAAAVAA